MFQKNKKIYVGSKQNIKSKVAIYLSICIFILFFLLMSIIYITYDYLVMKFTLSLFYTNTLALNNLYEPVVDFELNEQTSSYTYFNYFDDMAINTVVNQLSSVADDSYTYLYTSERYSLSKELSSKVADEFTVKEINDETVYVYLPNFSKKTEKLFKKNIDNIKSYDNLIIDLQNNYGGTTSSMRNISNLFLPSDDIIYSQVGRNSLVTKTYLSGSKNPLKYNNIALLTSNDTASSSEAFIMSLTDNLDNTIVIGNQTFGKGIAQVTIPLTKGYAFKATVLDMITPNGSSIHKTGITPDYEYNGNDIIAFTLSKFTN